MDGRIFVPEPRIRMLLDIQDSFRLVYYIVGNNSIATLDNVCALFELALLITVYKSRLVVSRERLLGLFDIVVSFAVVDCF